MYVLVVAAELTLSPRPSSHPSDLKAKNIRGDYCFAGKFLRNKLQWYYIFIWETAHIEAPNINSSTHQD